MMSPVVVEAEVDIRRPPEDVFDYCSDHRHEPQWNPMMKRAEKLTGGPVGAGTRYAAEFVKGPPMVLECTRYERPSAWFVTGESRALTARGGWRVLPTADGARLLMHTEMRLHGLLKLAAPMLRRRMQPMFQRDLDNIKTRLEAGQAASQTEPGQQQERQ
jgi:Polyketide cyclase / dehydrase and lipid transport